MADDSSPKDSGTTAAEEGNDSPPDPAIVKALKIKFGIVKRLTKDKQSYEKEAGQQRTLVTQYENEGKEATILKNAKNCLRETEMMIPDVCRRLTTAVGELKELVDSNRDTAVGKTEEYKEATRIMEDATTHLS